MQRDVPVLWRAGFVRAVALMFVLTLVQPLSGQIGSRYYVSTRGSDPNPGTFSAPWLTIQHAADSVSAGATVYVRGGVYHEAVNFPKSGTASARITFRNYPGQNAVMDGAGVSCCTSAPPSRRKGNEGLINIVNQSYITIQGFEIRNFTTANPRYSPVGVWVTGSGTGVHILNNRLHNITTTAESRGNAFGIAVYGTSKTPITQLVINGNEVYYLRTGNSESVTVDGNVTHFAITNNLIHDNDNIGIDAIGYESVGPVGYDEAMYGEVSGNTIYNISGVLNGGERHQFDADGLYCDGCAYVTFERNVIFQVDIGIETTSENQVCQANGTEWSGPNNTGTAAKGDFPCYGRFATVRNNIFYDADASGISFGGYGAAAATGHRGNGGGGSYHDVFVNNTLSNNGTQPEHATGELQMQHQVGAAQGNIFENNIVYAGAPNLWISNRVPFSEKYPAPPATLNWNVYDSAPGYVKGKSIRWGDVSTYTSFSNWQRSGGEDRASLNRHPRFVDLRGTPPDFDTDPSSPAVNAGSTSLSCSAGWCDPKGNSPDSIYGSTDFLGNPRTKNSKIDIGAYENTGAAIGNSLKVKLTAGTRALRRGQTTTLTVSVSADPGGGGVPSGTVELVRGSTVLEKQPLLPASATQSEASVPLNASQLDLGANSLTAVYSGNAIAPCCPVSGPPVPMYHSAKSAPITVTRER